MNENQDIRWKQRFFHYQNALLKIKQDLEVAAERDLSDMEKRGVIQAFEFTYELAWNVLKDFLEAQGEKTHGPRDAIRLAFNRDIIANGQTWMDMMESRNDSVHTYNEDIAEKIYHKIVDSYFTEFQALEKTLLEWADK